MRSLGLIAIALALCWTGTVFSQTQDDPADKPAAAPNSPSIEPGYGNLFGDPINQSPAAPAVIAADSDAKPSSEKEVSTTTIEQNGEEQEPPLVVRVYDVTDLILVKVSNYPARKVSDTGDGRALFPEKSDPFEQSLFQGSFGTGGLAADNGSMMSTYAEFDATVDLITKVISPSFWDDVGGRASIQPFGDLLVISTTEKYHAEIRSLLAQIRAHIASRKTIVVETHWLWLTEEQLNRLVPNSSGEVDERAWKIHQQLLNREDSELMPGYHATITCMNGQTASTVAGRQRRFIISLIPVVGDNGISPTPITTTPFSVGGTNNRAVGYQPQSSTVQEGAALQVRPILFGEDQVILDIHGRVVEVETPDQNEILSAGQPPKKADDNGGSDIRDIVKAVDRPVVNTSRIDTTFRAPLGTRTLVGGITGSTHPEPDEPNLYLFAKVTVKEPLKESQKNR